MVDESIQTKDAVHHKWTIPEYIDYEKSRRWYIVFSIIAIILIGLSVWYQNFLAAILVLLVAVIILARNYQSTLELEVSLRGDGIAIGQTFYPYKDIKNFWIIFEPPEVKTLYFEFQNSWRPRLPVSLEGMNPLEIRQTLLNYLEEDLERENEPTSDALGRLFRL